MPDYLKYQRSISEELNAQKDRVRNFIGGIHWGEDGRYKEVILREAIASRLPAFASIGTGFVVGNNSNEITTQIDIIVYRNDIPVLFKKEEFVIVSKDAVLGIIEVKTRIDIPSWRDALQKGTRNGQLIGNHIFNGIFGYDSNIYRDELTQTAEQECKSNPGFVNNITLGKNIFMKFWSAGSAISGDKDIYRIYDIENLAFGYFISNLIEDAYNLVCHQGIPASLRNMLYPIENTKEAHVKQTIEIPQGD